MQRKEWRTSSGLRAAWVKIPSEDIKDEDGEILETKIGHWRCRVELSENHVLQGQTFDTPDMMHVALDDYPITHTQTIDGCNWIGFDPGLVLSAGEVERLCDALASRVSQMGKSK